MGPWLFTCVPAVPSQGLKLLYIIILVPLQLLTTFAVIDWLYLWCVWYPLKTFKTECARNHLKHLRDVTSFTARFPFSSAHFPFLQIVGWRIPFLHLLFLLGGELLTSIKMSSSHTARDIMLRTMCKSLVLHSLLPAAVLVSC